MKGFSESEQRTMIRRMLGKIGLETDACRTGQLLQFYKMLIERNQVMNLTAITEFEDVLEKHFADSLLVCRVMDPGDVQSLIDVGTGAGFPGIPLKILYPQIRMTLLDSLHKRIGFLNDVITQLNLDGISAVHGRAEDYGRDPAYRERYDLCVSRAVADLPVLSELCLPFVRTGGMFLSYKSAAAVDEAHAAVHAARILGGSDPEIRHAYLPESGAERLFICIKKTGSTPDRYPRRAGVPGKKPLS